MCDHDSVLKLFGPSEIVHNYYTCNRNNCFSLTEREKKTFSLSNENVSSTNGSVIVTWPLIHVLVSGG